MRSSNSPPQIILDKIILELELKGQWQYQDNFCDYFDTFPQPPDKLRPEFWQRMSVDYFRQGGELCSLLEQHFSNGNRMMFYQITDTWKQGKAIANTKQLCQDQLFIDASR